MRWIALGLAVASVALVAETAHGAPSKPRACAGAISWQKAMRTVGKTVTVRGRVESAHYAKRSLADAGVTYLDLGARYPFPRRFTVVVFRDVSALEGRTVCVRGTVDAYGGVPQMQDVRVLRKVGW